MAANIAPIFSRLGAFLGSVWTAATTANVASDGTGTIGTDMLVAFLADATEGSFVSRVRFTPSASVASTATTSSVIRVYISTISSGATVRTNTFLFAEVPVPSQAADSPTAGMNYVEVPIGFALPAGATILWSMHHSANTNTSWQAIAIGGVY